MTATVRPLDRFQLVDTSNAEEAQAALTRIYAAPKLELISRGNTLRAIVNHCELRHVRVSYGSYAANLHMQFPETSFASQIFPIAGKSEAVLGRMSLMVSADRGVVISPNEALSVTNNAEYERLVLSVNSSSLANKLSAITGDNLCGRLKFHPEQNYLRPAAAALRRHFLFFVDAINAFAEALPDFVLAELEQTLLVMFLHGNQHNYSHILERTPRHASEQQLRRVEEYIGAHWRQEISLENLAAVSGVSALSLFRSFRERRGCSPMELLNRVRLNRARQLLQHPTGATRVSDVALACGFPDLGRFATDYMAAFGEQPWQTLDRSVGSGPPQGYES